MSQLTSELSCWISRDGDQSLESTRIGIAKHIYGDTDSISHQIVGESLAWGGNEKRREKREGGNWITQ